MLKFQRVDISDKKRIEAVFKAEKERGCEYTFGNVYIWRDVIETHVAFTDDGLVVVRFDAENAYLFPAGKGDLRRVMTEIQADSMARGVPLLMIAAGRHDIEKLDQLFPGKFQYRQNRDFSEYVYNSKDLIELAGKKYHGKRNHISRFMVEHKDYAFEEITRGNIKQAQAMCDSWYEAYLEEDDSGGLVRERSAVNNAFDRFFDLEFKGGLIRAGGDIAAFAMGEPINSETFCVHIEKACYEVNGAYTVINRDFAQHFCADYRYINREDDVGQEGLRKAKLSYHPAFLTEKYMVTEQ